MNSPTSRPTSVSRPRISRFNIVEIAVFIALLVAGSTFQGYEQQIMTKLVLLSILAISFDLCWGYSGIMAFGQALFFGSAGYAAALLSTFAHTGNLFVVLLLGGLVGLTGSFLVAWFLLLGRRKTEIIFVSLGTLTASYIAERLVGGWQLIGAANGISVPDPLRIGSYELYPGPVFFYFSIFVLACVYCLVRFLVRSQFGLVLSGMRQNEERLAFFGYRVQVYKAIVFCLAGLIAGMAGCLFAFHESYIGPTNIGFVQSTYAALYALFGGPGTLLGPILGVFVIEGVGFAISDVELLRGIWPAIMGVLMVVVVVYRPKGIIGFLVSDRDRRGSFFAGDAEMNLPASGPSSPTAPDREGGRNVASPR
ncbi:branched-chain amino acid ABC transporter permease [Mesorhizobium sp. CO1-1-8]|uniref:branched-chain amino acid ABC transporter permease n=1 Tax=Mesorhizobium sp. CO1-1-8 TaxID=2876631 RepID=UPI001CD05DE8|nr:branched-chain amino acid ABC transporter permease [Mesorhizobium sp. CO1-1-8]MBZ9772469.1 branched-chain amino acid ABC transporter permease [Mesorhizobium sp. CO1-1-8]